ncbi:hypothetical protein [Ruminococcus sp.]|uniref:hypothetical protein n=1 Tax=Ruminococcus sp. TaxID=41978 RepID=UPI0025D54244|nr:hypothetical protein [Ruminococcus sp.]MBQ6252485.1 hypothetical protein [Ruminococcus sp.]
MKDFLEKRIFSMKWLFAIIVISFFIETFNHPSDVNAFLSKFISDTVPIEVINRVLTGSGVGIVIWFIIRKLINMQNGENDFFTIYESPVIVDIFIWVFYLNLLHQLSYPLSITSILSIA